MGTLKYGFYRSEIRVRIPPTPRLILEVSCCPTDFLHFLFLQILIDPMIFDDILKLILFFNILLNDIGN